MDSLPHFFFLFLFLILIPIPSPFSDAGSVCVNYGMVADDLPPPSKAIQLLKANGLTCVKLFDINPSLLNSLSNTGIKVTLHLPNELLSSIAAHPSSASSWLSLNIIPHLPSTQIEAIAVGNEVFVSPNNLTSFVLPAMRNLHTALSHHNLHSQIKVSSPLALSVLHTSYPSSAGSFDPVLLPSVIQPMLSFLRETSSFLMVNAYPFFAYESNADVISLDYALFLKNPGVVDSGNGRRYFNLFDAQIDAVFSAMDALGFDDVEVVVTETGWPSRGDSDEIGAGVDNAAAYNGNLVRRILTEGGTPLRPKADLRVYLFALFNEDRKPSPTSERNYGLFYPNGSKVYDIAFTVEGLGERRSSQKGMPGGGGGVDGVRVKSSSSSSTSSWCVATEGAGKEELQKALDYACGEGGAECGPIQPKAACYSENTVVAHASYAFNSYYQKHHHNPGSCYFNGAAQIVTHQPVYGKCVLPAE